MTDQLLESAKKRAEEAKLLKPKWKVGDTVRVLKSLDCNICEVEDYLGSKCIVERVRVPQTIFSRPKVEYILRLNDRLEPFFEDELDHRFKNQC